MQKANDPGRNRPTDTGKDQDPHVRDDSAFQPGIQTNSPSGYDDDNQRVTRSAMDDNEQQDFDVDDKADAAFDDMDED